MASILRTPDLELRVEDQYQLEALTFLEQVIMHVMERVGEKSTPPEYEFLHAPETNLSIREFKQLPQTPDMSPIIRSKIQSRESMPHFPLSQTKLCVGLDKTQDIILELLINSIEIYLA